MGENKKLKTYCDKKSMIKKRPFTCCITLDPISKRTDNFCTDVQFLVHVQKILRHKLKQI